MPTLFVIHDIQKFKTHAFIFLYRTFCLKHSAIQCNCESGKQNSGTDGIPVLFSRLAAIVFCLPLFSQRRGGQQPQSHGDFPYRHDL